LGQETDFGAFVLDAAEQLAEDFPLAMDVFGDPGLGGTLALFYATTAIVALLAMHRRD